MALIKCPECNKDVSSSALSCPNCGFDVKHRKWYMKKYGQYLIIIVLIFVLYNAYTFYKNTFKLVDDINELLEYEVVPSGKAYDVLEQYENLFILEKLFVHNFKKLKSKKIEPSNDLLRKYLDIDLEYNNYIYNDSKTIIGIKTYKEEVNVTVNIDAKIIRTEDFSYELDLGNGYKFNKEIYCNEQCNIDAVVEKGGILNNSIIYDPKRPTAEINKLKFKNITGYIYIK